MTSLAFITGDGANNLRSRQTLPGLGAGRQVGIGMLTVREQEGG